MMTSTSSSVNRMQVRAMAKKGGGGGGAAAGAGGANNKHKKGGGAPNDDDAAAAGARLQLLERVTVETEVKKSRFVARVGRPHSSWISSLSTQRFHRGYTRALYARSRDIWLVNELRRNHKAGLI